jgi:MFS superfamily sulfate permease-like transporter
MADSTKLNPEEAYNILVAQVHAPIFFNKLASVYGIVPQTPEEARELLLIAGQLRNAHEQDQTKQANARTGFFTEARRDLNKALGHSGFQPSVEEDANAKQAAAAAVKNPLIKEAAIVFSNYMAQTLQGK